MLRAQIQEIEESLELHMTQIVEKEREGVGVNPDEAMVNDVRGAAREARCSLRS